MSNWPDHPDALEPGDVRYEEPEVTGLASGLVICGDHPECPECGSLMIPKDAGLMCVNCGVRSNQ